MHAGSISRPLQGPFNAATVEPCTPVAYVGQPLLPPGPFSPGPPPGSPGSYAFRHCPTSARAPPAAGIADKDEPGPATTSNNTTAHNEAAGVPTGPGGESLVGCYFSAGSSCSYQQEFSTNQAACVKGLVEILPHRQQHRQQKLQNIPAPYGTTWRWWLQRSPTSAHFGGTSGPMSWLSTTTACADLRARGMRQQQQTACWSSSGITWMSRWLLAGPWRPR